MTATILVSARDAAVHLGISTQAISGLRKRGSLRAVRTGPFRFALADIEALKVKRAGRKFGRPAQGVEIVTTGEK